MREFDAEDVLLWAGVSIFLALFFVDGVITGDPLQAYIFGPLFGLWFGYGLGWMRVRLKAGRS